MMNLIYNAQGGTLREILSHIDILLECETDKISALETQRNYILISCIIVLSLSGFVISIYLICSDKYINTLWDQLRSRSYLQATILNQVIFERLKKYHYDLKKEECHYEDTKKTLSVKHSLRFMAKLSFLFAIALIFLLLTSLYFYSHVKDYLYHRPLLIGYFSRRQLQLNRMSYTLLESYAINRNYSLEEYYPELTPIEPAKLYFESIYLDINKNNIFLFDQFTRELLGQSILDLVFNKVNNVSAFIETGTYAAVNYLCQESYYFLNDPAFQNSKDLNKLFGNINDFSSKVQENLVELVIDNTKSKIQIEMNEMIAFVVCVSFFLLLTYFIYYLPIVQNEIKILNSIVKILIFVTKVK